MLRRFSLAPVLAYFTETFGLGRGAAISAVVFIVGVLWLAVYVFIHSGPPTKITITTGPAGSIFETNGQRYAAILARNGIQLKVLPSKGSLENLDRLQNPRVRVDLGFVQGGVTNALNSETLVSLGSVAYQPLFIFYRGEATLSLISEFAGKRLSIGPAGSGTRSLALTLLATNGVSADGRTTLLDLEAEQAARELQAGSIDAVFFMADSATSQVLRQLFRAPGIKLFDVKQADGYTRRFRYLNKLELPMGAFDFGRNIPPNDVRLIGPTVELVARADLHPVLSDLLMEAAQEVHGKATLLQRQGEFPSGVEHDFRISPEASRYYKTGKSLLYRMLPFWLAGLVNRILVVFVPMIVLLIPGLRIVPTIYRWRMRLRISRWYRALRVLEHDLPGGMDAAQRESLLQRLDAIEDAVNRMKLPASFGDQFYGLRGHISLVRDRLTKTVPAR